jgi:nitroreductase
MISYHQEIKNAVIKSQHCQRNFDLSKEIPEADLELIVHAATNCPSKQNIRFYNLHVITDRDLIAKVHELTTGVTAKDLTNDSAEIDTTNSQTLANVLFVFERREIEELSEKGAEKWNRADAAEVKIYERDLNVAIGIAAGYTNVVSSLLGYSTGCCQCFQWENIRDLLRLKNEPVLLMGIGYKDPNRNRREHATNSNLMFPTRKKEDIIVTYR